MALIKLNNLGQTLSVWVCGGVELEINGLHQFLPSYYKFYNGPDYHTG